MIVADLIQLLLKCPPGARVRQYPDVDLDAVWLEQDQRNVLLDRYPPAISGDDGLIRVE